MAIVDYTFYTDEFGGSIVPEESFLFYERQAESYLDRLTFGRIEPKEEVYGQWIRWEFVPLTEKEMDMLKNGLCALIETIHNLKEAESRSLSGNEDSGNIKTRSSGGESISYEVQSTAYTEALQNEGKKMRLYKSRLMEWIIPERFQYNPFNAGSR